MLQYAHMQQATSAACWLQNTKVQGAINHLFEGHTFNYVECVNVDYKSTRKESYMDLQLDVKGCKDVYASFAKYTEVEMLDGQNQYKAEGHGLQVRPLPAHSVLHAATYPTVLPSGIQLSPAHIASALLRCTNPGAHICQQSAC